MSASEPRRGRMFWRIYLHGLLLLVLASLAAGATNLLVGPPPPWRDYLGRLAGYLGDQPAALEDPKELSALLDRDRALTGTHVTVFALDGSILGSSAHRPPPPLAPDGVRRVLDSEGRPTWHPGHRLAAPVIVSGRPVAYLVASGRRFGEHFERGAAVLAVVLLVLAVASIPQARAIAAPLERLTEAARALGSGNLSARSGLRAQGEVGALAGAFDDMAERLERLLLEEKELLANISHELRTPLSRIRVALELAAEGDAAQARRYLGEIGADLAELETLVEDVLTAARLDFARARPGASPPVRPEPVDPAALLESAAARFREANADRRLELAVDALPPSVEGDPALLRRAVANLLDNARKYSEPDQPIRLAARGEGDALHVEVHDRGIGIDPADLPQIFSAFFRTDRSRARGTGGVGLGLALVKRIAEAHGGRVFASSTPAEGTRVGFEIPAPPRDRQA